jgi:isopentenyldiphosphate isomerase
MKNPEKEEWFPVVDEDGNEISTALRSVCHDGKSMLLHPVVHLHLFNNKGELFLQKRALTKDLLPGKWDTAVGGHISPGEHIDDALKRETLEELGIKDFNYKFHKKYIWESYRERELVYTFTGTAEKIRALNPVEIDEGRFWPVKEIQNNLGKNVFTPNFEYEFSKFLYFGAIISVKMSKSVKILTFNNGIEANLLGEILTEKDIPHIIRSYHDSAYDGLWQTPSAWGFLEAPPEFKEEILKTYAEMSLPENQTESI